jgi:hypothetical protein
MTIACNNCRRRKLKCDNNKPCTTCVSSQLECRKEKTLILGQESRTDTSKLSLDVRMIEGAISKMDLSIDKFGSRGWCPGRALGLS